MFDTQDEDLGPVLTLVIGIAIVVSLFTIAVALSVAGVFGTGTDAATRQPATATTAETLGTLKIHFPLASATLPEGAAASLFPLLVAATIEPGRRIEISGFHDASGDADKNIELARARAVAVRDAIVASGVPPDRIVLRKPVEVLGGTDPEAARRVEVDLR